MKDTERARESEDDRGVWGCSIATEVGRRVGYGSEGGCSLTLANQDSFEKFAKEWE